MSTVCRPAANACDVAEHCPGDSAACPGDQRRPEGSPCDDGNACTTGDSCRSGTCKGDPVSCVPSGPCKVSACNPASGTCSETPADNGTACDDHNACTTGDSCQGGMCTPTNTKSCSASTFCKVSTCDPASGGCVESNKAPGTPCTDGDACTTGDSCQQGVCTGTPVACTALDACHDVGVCDSGSGVCSNPPKTGTPCQICPAGQPCRPGTCQAGACTECTPGDHVCLDNTTRKVCNQSGLWDTESCQNNTICSINALCELAFKLQGSCSGGTVTATVVDRNQATVTTSNFKYTETAGAAVSQVTILSISGGQSKTNVIDAGQQGKLITLSGLSDPVHTENTSFTCP
jgi:hypothetical protein